VGGLLIICEERRKKLVRLARADDPGSGRKVKTLLLPKIKERSSGEPKWGKEPNLSGEENDSQPVFECRE